MQEQRNESHFGSPTDAASEAVVPPAPTAPDGMPAAAAQADVAGVSLWRHLGRRLRQHPLDAVLLVAFVVLAGLGVLGAHVAPYDPTALYVGPGLTAPSPAHLFGTDELGRDVFSRVLAGTPYSLASAGLILGSALLISILVGTIAGYYGGLVDTVIMRITDMFLAFPSLILALAITAALGPGLTNALLAISLVWWPWYARLIRGQVLAIRQREYVEAARAVGISSTRVMFRHILPNYLAPLVVQVSLDVGSALVTTASLGFLGLGAQPPTPEWGTMIGAGRQYFLSAWWYSGFPGLAIFVVVLLFTILSERLPAYLF
jgi:peptide/nickel transport system permease protein